MGRKSFTQRNYRLGAEKDFAVHQLGHELSAKFILHMGQVYPLSGEHGQLMYMMQNQPDLRSMQEESGM